MIGASSSARPRTVQVTLSTGPCRMRGDRERLQAASDDVGFRLDLDAVADGVDPLVVGRGELERAHLADAGLPPAGLDARGRAELVEQPGHLLGRLLDHRQEALRPLVQLVRPRQRACEAVDRRQRRPQVVARE